MVRADSAGVSGGIVINDPGGAVCRAVVDGNDVILVVGVVGGQQGLEHPPDHFLLVVTGHEHGDPRPGPYADVHVGLTVPPEDAVQREDVVADRVDHEDGHDDPEADGDHIPGGHGRRSDAGLAGSSVPCQLIPQP